MSGSISHPGDVSELPAGPPTTQESVNHATPICSTSDNVLSVTYPPPMVTIQITFRFNMSLLNL